MEGNMEKKRIDWTELEALVAQAVAVIIKDEWRPTMVVALSRGGFIPATMIAHGLGVKRLGGLAVEKDQEGVRSLSQHTQLHNLDEQRVLLVDDGIISGRLLGLAAEAVRDNRGEPRTCALISVGQSPDPDYLVQKFDEMPQFPWEDAD